MTRTIGIGVIGLGWMGITHSRSYREISHRFHDSGIQPRLVLCADEVESRARQTKARFGFERCTADWKQVIADPAVEVVNIAASNNVHLEIARAAAEAGKHIFCEKPVGRNPQETDEIARAARRAGVLTFVGYNYRWAPLVQYAHQLIQTGRLGKLTHYRGKFFTGWASNPKTVLTWRFQRELAGLGTLGDLLSHVIDMAHMIAGPIKRVIGNRETFVSKRPVPMSGEGTHTTTRTEGPMGDVTNEDYAGALVQFDNGAHGTLEACRIISGMKSPMAFEVNGTRGALSWDFERMNELHLYLPDESSTHDGYVRIVGGPEHPFHARFNPGPGIGLGYEELKIIEAHQFLKSILDGQQAAPGFAEASAVAQVQSAIQHSWDTGHWEDVGRLRKQSEASHSIHKSE
jgi:predicted dehydrogenase